MTLSRICFGTAGLTEYYSKNFKPRNPQVLLEYAYKKGIHLFDTAPTYGESERMVADLKQKYPDVKISTKCKNRDDIVASLDLFGYIDIMFIHNYSLDNAEHDLLLERLHILQQTSKIGKIGVSIYDPKDIPYGYVNIIQAPYSIIDQRFNDSMQNIGFMARSVFYRGRIPKNLKYCALPFVIFNKNINYINIGFNTIGEIDYAINMSKRVPTINPEY